VQPLVGQGWTLNYEMFFYVIFALAMLAGSRAKAIGIAAAVLVAFYLLGKLVTPLPTALAFWSGSIALEFIFGMLIALAYRRGVRLPRWACYALLLAGPLLALAFWYYPTGSRPFGWGIAASAIVAGAVFGDFAPGRRWKFLSAVGDASYALYLIHAVPIRLFLMAVVALGLDIGKAPWLYLVLAVAGTVLLALAIYYLFERPLTVALRNRIGAPRPATAAGSSRAPGKTRAIW
jgi:peptidoglycan/LPS O-acetylase OafA/YrhL